MRILSFPSVSILGIAAVALGMAADSDPIMLVDQLGSSRPFEREAAATALETLGSKALPALRAGRDRQNPEVQERVRVLIRKIEGDQLIRPTMITLDFRDRPMSEILHGISDKTGFFLNINGLRVDWLAQKVTVREPAPVPFWKAVDRICEAGQFHYNLASSSGGATIMFFKKDHSGPASDHGAFRLQIEEIYHNGRYRQLHLGRDDSSRLISREEDRDKSYLRLRVMVEPRMRIRKDGELKGLSIIDDTGQSLAPSGPGGEPARDDLRFSLWELIQVPLERVPRPGRTIRNLRGLVPVAVASRRPVPLIIPLADAVGRSFRGDESVVTIQRVRKIPHHMRIALEPVGPEMEQERPEATPRASAH